ncbi:unnamed protein product [Acanthosepion pharaonis]|uniref:Uncharacterized protein n=1 Tax=Acanthosepion pharaonis TaxID=158019 RepID=A0A812B824_ACAPH|nr:unnamed protein product [Sepia pharaonis]
MERQLAGDSCLQMCTPGAVSRSYCMRSQIANPHVSLRKACIYFRSHVNPPLYLYTLTVYSHSNLRHSSFPLSLIYHSFSCLQISLYSLSIGLYCLFAYISLISLTIYTYSLYSPPLPSFLLPSHSSFFLYSIVTLSLKPFSASFSLSFHCQLASHFSVFIFLLFLSVSFSFSVFSFFSLLSLNSLLHCLLASLFTHSFLSPPLSLSLSHSSLCSSSLSRLYIDFSLSLNPSLPHVLSLSTHSPYTHYRLSLIYFLSLYSITHVFSLFIVYSPPPHFLLFYCLHVSLFTHSSFSLSLCTSLSTLLFFSLLSFSHVPLISYLSSLSLFLSHWPPSLSFLSTDSLVTYFSFFSSSLLTFFTHSLSPPSLIYYLSLISFVFLSRYISFQYLLLSSFFSLYYLLSLFLYLFISHSVSSSSVSLLLSSLYSLLSPFLYKITYASCFFRATSRDSLSAACLFHPSK